MRHDLKFCKNPYCSNKVLNGYAGINSEYCKSCRYMIRKGYQRAVNKAWRIMKDAKKDSENDRRENKQEFERRISQPVFNNKGIKRS